jgi:hypothetical protein
MMVNDSDVCLPFKNCRHIRQLALDVRFRRCANRIAGRACRGEAKIDVGQGIQQRQLVFEVKRMDTIDSIDS